MEFDSAMIVDAKKLIKDYLLGYYVDKGELLKAAQIMTFYNVHDTLLDLQDIKNWCGAEGVQI